MPTYYQTEIIKITGCPECDAPELELAMRQTIFAKAPHNGNLDGLTARAFIRGANYAREMQLFMRTPEGVAMCERIEREILMLD